jgi:hypothetical protein
MPMQNVEDYKIFNPKTEKPMFWKYRNVEQWPQSILNLRQYEYLRINIFYVRS